jgi:2'-5' RNA ligase
MSRILTTAITLLALSSQAFSASYPLDHAIQDGSGMKFIEHSGKGAMDSYLAMNLPFEPMAALFQQFQGQISHKLINRGEAHITVITPVEYSQQLKPFGITIEKINEIAEAMKIQKSSFQIVCLGKGQSNIDNKEEETYFIVVHSEDLLKIRRKVQSLLANSKNGAKSDFQADKFYSHITLGFTKRDLHEADGVIKNNDSCIADLSLNP